MADPNDETVPVRITKEQREVLRMLKSSGESYPDAFQNLLDQSPEEYSAIRKIAEQKAQNA